MVILQESDNTCTERADLTFVDTKGPQRIEVVVGREKRIYERSHYENGAWVCRYANSEALAK